MKIEAGKMYVTRGGDAVEIKPDPSPDNFYKFIGSNETFYSDDGRALDGYPSSRDLILPVHDRSNSAWWWALGVCLVGVLVMLWLHWGPVVFPGG